MIIIGGYGSGNTDALLDLINNQSDIDKLFYCFHYKSYVKVPKDVRLNPTHFFIFPNKRELQQIALNHLSEIDFKDFIKIYRKCNGEPYSFLVNDTTYHQIRL